MGPLAPTYDTSVPLSVLALDTCRTLPRFICTMQRPRGAIPITAAMTAWRRVVGLAPWGEGPAFRSATRIPVYRSRRESVGSSPRPNTYSVTTVYRPTQGFNTTVTSAPAPNGTAFGATDECPNSATATTRPLSGPDCHTPTPRETVRKISCSRRLRPAPQPGILTPRRRPVSTQSLSRRNSQVHQEMGSVTGLCRTSLSRAKGEVIA